MNGNEIAVQFHPGHWECDEFIFFILASEAAAGQWEIRWSVDMSEVYEYGITHEEEPVENGRAGMKLEELFKKDLQSVRD